MALQDCAANMDCLVGWLYSNIVPNIEPQFWHCLALLSEHCGDLVLQATLYVYEMKGSEMAVTKIEHPDPSLES